MKGYTELTEIQPQQKPKPQPPQITKGSLFAFAKPYVWTKLSLCHRILVVISIILLIGANIIKIFSTITLKELVNNLSEGENVQNLVILFVCLQFGGELCNNLRQVAFVQVEAQIESDLASDVFSHVLALSMKYHLTRETGKVLRSLQRGSLSFSSLFRTMMFSLSPIVIQLLMVMTYMGAAYDWYYPMIFIGSIMVYILFTYFTTEWRTKIQRRMNEMDNKFNSKSADALINFETVKYFNAEGHESRRYSEAFGGYKNENVKMQNSLAILNLGQQLCIQSSMALCLLIMANKVYHGENEVGDFVLVNSFMMQLYTPLNFLGTYYRMIRQAIIDVEGVLTLLHEHPDVPDPEFPQILQMQRGDIEFRNVSFRYAPEHPLILDNVSFTVPSGSTLAIVGPTGSGKSTIIKLLYRFYDIDEGEIVVDGINIKNVKQSELRRHIAIVPQDCSLFNDTILYNIAYGGAQNPFFDMDSSDTRKAVEWATSKAQLSSFIQRQSQGFDTVVGERGLRLSGGEKQRVAIARALLKQPEVMCFDEATSSLDSKTEKEIQDALNKVSQGKTTLIIAHRLSTIKHADMIIVLSQGSVIEMGSHSQLLEADGLYSLLWNEQLREEKEIVKANQQDFQQNDGSERDLVGGEAGLQEEHAFGGFDRVAVVQAFAGADFAEEEIEAEFDEEVDGATTGDQDTDAGQGD